MRGFLEGILDATECVWLPLPASVVSEPVVRQFPSPAQHRQVGLHLDVAGLGLLDEVANGGLIEHLSHRHRLAVVNDDEQSLASCLDLGPHHQPFWLTFSHYHKDISIATSNSNA